MTLLLPLLTLLACDDYDLCTKEAVLALQVDVTDADGEPLPGATVTFIVNDGPERAASCLDAEDPLECTSFATAYEEAGIYEVLVEYTLPIGDDGCCWHSDAKTATVEVRADECHVLPEQVTVAIDTSVVSCLDEC